MVEGADFELESVSMGTTERTLGSDSCEEWLEKEDAVVYARDFDIDPILVTGDEKEWMTCGRTILLKHDGRMGFNVVMTTSLSSDVPLCAHNFRLQALNVLEKFIKIGSYGSCHQNHDGKVDKVETLKRYKFSLAFENSNEEDYVIEKFFQSLVAGGKKEETGPGFKRRPCRCTRGSETVYHLYVRERGRFEMESIFLRCGNLTPSALEAEVLKKFKSLKHVPIWKQERPERIRGDNLKVYRVYPVGMTQRQALYTFKFNTDDDFKNHLEVNPCAKFEVIFVKGSWVKPSDIAKCGSFTGLIDA
ncbi:GLYCOSYL TRANSFERASE FAMILY 10-RELATED [Salix koriyanagi]|uniref:Fucosyltransferase n=1 Tax=Salix koriyanagi TaxID=2511006 RepID=A0A9Q0UYQ7_9ROSI|nr:GLYCOSYL TRANSFERASE FAMILY 10-RELATED [Salix koriyanagi]